MKWFIGLTLLAVGAFGARIIPEDEDTNAGSNTNIISRNFPDFIIALLFFNFRSIFVIFCGYIQKFGMYNSNEYK